MKNKTKKLLKKEIQEKYNYDGSFDEIRNKIDFAKKENKSTLPTYRLLKYSLLVVSILLISFITGFSVVLVNNIKLKNKEPKIIEVERVVHVKDDKTIITEEQKKYMYSMCDYLNNTPIYYILFDASISMYIYRGETVNENYEFEVRYFYVIYYYDAKKKNIVINIDDNKIVIDDTNLCGLLLSIVDSDIEKLIFSIKLGDKERIYSLQN